MKGAKHYYTYGDEKGKIFVKISNNFTNLDKIQQTVGIFANRTNINECLYFNGKEILR
ncbi:hypothetical protein PspKH34_30380 [Parageobacillus sp. KH3-4]|nr:hypothetical protein PspKH34_30380 [Parageobacillus sp. KH3-4]